MQQSPTNLSTVSSMLGEIRAMLEEAQVPDPAPDAELILAHVLGESRGRVQALAVMGAGLSDGEQQRARALGEERARRTPLQHLTGRAPFRSIELSVGPGVFVPRPETEMVAGLAIEALRAADGEEPIAVDLCTGSGAIALALAVEVPEARIWAVEKSIEAHAWASRNVAALGEGRVELLLGDIAELDRPDWDSTELGRSLEHLRGRVSVLVSNPPYVPDAMVPRDPEVRDHDPELALYGGRDGLDVVRIIARVARDLLLPAGVLVLEHAEGQGRAIRELLAAAGWRDPMTHRDLTDRDRATTATLGV